MSGEVKKRARKWKEKEGGAKSRETATKSTRKLERNLILLHIWKTGEKVLKLTHPSATIIQIL